MSRWFALGVILLAAGAWALRAPQLDRRPFHNDEANNAFKLQALWEKGEYKYDPNEFHGPSLYYASLPFLWLSHAQNFDQLDDATLRHVTVFFGVALVLLVGLLADALGRPAALCAAGLTAISPAMVFYSRYLIHEMLLACFTMLLLAAGWRYSRTPRAGWAAIAGAGLGLMYATKETFVLELAAMTAAGVMTIAWTRWYDHEPLPWRGFWNTRHGIIALGVALVVSVLLFTSFFTNVRGLLDSLLTYLPWTKRAGGHTSHIHPWYFYLQRLAFFHAGKGPMWSEGLILLLSAVGLVAGIRGRALAGASVFFVRLVGFYTLALTGAYSVISYKTPWCLLGFLHGMILLAGVGTAVLIQLCRRRWLQIALGAGLLAATGQLTWQAWRASFVFPADRRNPYVYAQTVPDILRLVERVKGIAKVHPQGHQMLIKVAAPDGDYWPLPWYLRQLKRVGWWDKLPDDPYAPVTIVGATLQAALDDKSDKKYLSTGFFELRPLVYFELYVEFDLWRKYVETLPKERD